ncbi:MAG: hypothetical protein QXM00_03610 [Candidatus Bathyarchaeia archaeon]
MRGYKRIQNVIPAFLAFMNSTFRFIHLLGERVETEGALCRVQEGSS